MVAGAELGYDTSASAFQMAQTIFGDGVTVSNASYSGAGSSSAIYSNGATVSGFVTPSDTGVILSTGNATDFTGSGTNANSSGNLTTNTTGADNDAQFNAIAGTNTYDASVLTVDFTPDPGFDTMTIKFIFSSDEYPEYVGSIYNDMVGVWINDTHIPLSIAEDSTQINAVNQNQNINLYNDNTSSQYNTEMDGFTVTMSLTIPVNPDELNTIRIGVADVGDSSFDSNLLIAADSVQAVLIAQQDFVTMKDSVTKTVDVLENDINNTSGTLQITHINGVAVVANQTITLATGQAIKLNADGTFDITTDDDFETQSFTYDVASIDTAGNTLETHVGFVTVETIPCFVAGTTIETVDGPRAIESLCAGDMVVTRDDGPQPLRWMGRRTVPAVGKMAPIRFQENALGKHGALKVSPLHRILITDAMADLFFGEPEVLVAAKDLVNDHSIRPIQGGTVDYVHLLFDRHQVIYAEGLPTESFLPGPHTTKAFEDAALEEIASIFPDLDITSGTGYGPAARLLLKRHEAEAIRHKVT